MREIDIRRFPAWLHGELMNWSRWCWSGAYPHPMPPTTCASVEREYRAKGEDAVTDSKPVPPNEANAKVVDKIWRSLPEMQKKILRAEYPGRGDYEWNFGRVGVARKMGIRLSEYEAHLFGAVSKVWEAFEQRGRV